MASYLNRLESLIERWQSRRKTIEISQAGSQISTSGLDSGSRKSESTGQLTENESGNNNSYNNEGGNENHQLQEEDEENGGGQKGKGTLSTAAVAAATTATTKTTLTTANIFSQQTSRPNSMFKLIKESSGRREEALKARIENLELSRSTVATCPSLIYVSIVLISLLCLQVPIQEFGSLVVASTIAYEPQELAIGNFPTQPDWKSMLGLNPLPNSLLRDRQRNRWINVPSSSASSSASPSASPSASALSPLRDGHRFRRAHLAQALHRISNRIGARNTIRVHNAFRDFAWRILSSLSMPTPVIYELRRQHFYSPEDDQMNDSLFDKNTTKTIRSKRLLELWRPIQKAARRISLNGVTHRADDYDDEEPEGFRDRVRMRLEELVNLPRRSLFGRVVRLPSLFPFKRHQDEEDNERSSTSREVAPITSLREGKYRLFRRRKRKEADRQIISINGKQYYVDEDGELRRLENDKNERRAA